MAKSKATKRTKPLRRAAIPVAVAAVFEAAPAPLRNKLLAMRRRILDTARTTEGVGPLEETLKWGQPSYLTAATKAGSTIRLDRIKDSDDRYAIYFHCQTDLIATFRELYPADMNYGGSRSIVFNTAQRIPERALRHCIALALTYHLRRRPPRADRRP